MDFLDYLGGMMGGAGAGPGTGGMPAGLGGGLPDLGSGAALGGASALPNGGMSTGPSWVDKHPLLNSMGLGPTAGTSQGFIQNLGKFAQNAPASQGNTPMGGGGGGGGALNWNTPANSGKLSF